MSLRRRFSGCVFDLSLASAWRKTAVLLAVGIAAALMAGEGARLAVVAVLAESFEPRKIQRALVLDPSSPELHYRLGLVDSYALKHLDPVEGVRELRRATELAPHVAGYWAALGSACDSIGDTACADTAFERALRLSPMTPRLHWMAGNHYLLNDRNKEGMAHFRRLLEVSPSYAGSVFAASLGAVGDPKAVLEGVLSGAEKNPELTLSFINFLCASGKADFAREVWQTTAARTSAFRLTWVKPYLASLLELRRFRDAANVWRDLERMRVVDRPRSSDSADILFNGDFERSPLNAGLDWHIKAERFLAVDFSDPRAYHGAGCLRVEFTVARNEDYEPVYQIVPVTPGGTYELSGYVRTEDVTSDSGPRLHVLDLDCSDCLNVSTETTIGTAPWHRVSVEFAAGARTEFLRVSVWRPRSRSFPSEIAGRFWIDAVTLKIISPLERSHGPARQS